jgi:hypothetical protein
MSDRLIDATTHPVLKFLGKFEPQSHDGIVVRLKLAVVQTLSGWVLLLTLPLWMAWLAFQSRSILTPIERTPSNRKAQPLNAEFLFYVFFDAKNCDAIVGDLEERYNLILKKFGKRRADFWYWTQAIRSVAPVVWAWAKKTAVKPIISVIAWAVAKGLVERDSWLAAVVELCKRVLS